MPWVKHVSGSKIVFTPVAPDPSNPIVSVTFDTKAKMNPWTLTYAWVNSPDKTSLADIEKLLGL
jgi:hypothetical protein